MALREWHPWFAWWPVSLSYEVNERPGFSYAASGDWAWLRWVERRVRFGWTEYRRPR